MNSLEPNQLGNNSGDANARHLKFMKLPSSRMLDIVRPTNVT